MSEKLPKKIKERLQKETIINEAYFTALFYNNPSLYAFYPEDKINVKTFQNPAWGFYYGLGRSLFNKGVKVFDDISVVNHVNELGVTSKFEGYGGFSTVEEVADEVQGKEENIEAYYDEVKKYALLRSLVMLFGEKVLTPNGKYNYKTMTKNQLHIYWNDQVNQLGMDGDNKYDEHDLLNNLRNDIVRWNMNPAVGLPYYKSPQLTKITTGWDYGNLYIMGGFGGSGKAQDLDSNILTPNGYVKMRDIKIGDEIFGEDGKTHFVLGVFPQGKKDMYEVIFSDGSKTITCDEHLWNVQNPTKREEGSGEFKTLTLRQIMDKGLFKIYGKKTYKTWMHYIPMTKPLDFTSNSNLDLPPYLLGLLLGDGMFNGNSIMVSINNSEPDLVDYIFNYCNENNFTLVINSKRDGCTDYRISRNDNSCKNKLKHSLEKMGLHPALSNGKFIPQEYLYSSIENRIDLLSGLIDTDGEVNGSSYTYSTVSQNLAKDIKFLVQSLGGTAKIAERQTYYTHNNEKRAGQKSYRIYIKMPRDIRPFKSVKHQNSFKEGQTDARRTIREVKYIGKREAQCIKTSNPTQLYLTDEMIVTHNTSMSFNKVIMSCIAEKEKLLILANEQGIDEFKKMLIITAMGVGTKSGFNRQRINEGNYSDEEMEKMEKAVEWVEQLSGGDDSLIKFVFMEDYIMEDVKKVIRHYSARGYKSVMVDTGKPSEGGNGKARWEQFTDDFKDLYKLCRPNGGGLNLRMWVNVQLADTALRNKFLDEHAFGDSKKIKNEASVVFMIRGLHADEYEGGANEVTVYKWEHDPANPFSNEHGMYKKEFTLEKGTVYYAVFVPKNRRGRDNKTGLDILIVKPNFNNNTWYEVGWTDSIMNDRNY